MAEKMSKTVVVHRPVSECFNLWSNFDNFPNFMEHIKEVRKIGERESHWLMEGPMGKDVEWSARTTSLEPNRRIAWSSYEGDVDTNGEVTFREIGANETEITVVMAYAAKGALADFVAKYFTNTGDWLEEDLRNFKRYAEQGGTARARTAGRTYRSEYAPDAEEEMPDPSAPRTTGTYRERTGAGAMGSTPGGTMGTPTGGSIGGTTGGSTGGSTGSTGGTFGTSSSGSEPRLRGTEPGGTSGTRGTTGSDFGAGKTGDREHSDKLDRDRDINERDRNRDREDL